MRIIKLTVACAIAVAAPAIGAGSIISSFRSPCPSPLGMCYDGGYIYHMNYPRGIIYKTTPKGFTVGRVEGPENGIGVHFTGVYFWVCTYSPGMVYRLSSSGSVISSFAGPALGSGITGNGPYLWYSSARGGNKVWKLTTSGSVVASFKAPGSFIGGLDWDSRGNLWLADYPLTNGTVFRLTTTGSVAEFYRRPGRPSGSAWDGDYVWYCDYLGRYVYQVDTLITSILPSSLGKVKSIYR